MVKAKGKEKINKVAFLWDENPWIYEAFTIPWLAKGAVIITVNTLYRNITIASYKL